MDEQGGWQRVQDADDLDRQLAAAIREASPAEFERMRSAAIAAARTAVRRLRLTTDPNARPV